MRPVIPIPTDSLINGLNRRGTSIIDWGLYRESPGPTTISMKGDVAEWIEGLKKFSESPGEFGWFCLAFKNSTGPCLNRTVICTEPMNTEYWIAIQRLNVTV